jgi:ribose 5-phosphate isomerase B
MPSTTYTVAIGSDHAGFPLKEPISQLLRSLGHKLLDFGCADDASCDYPDYIRPTAEAISAGKADLGIVLGGSGNGEAIVANKVPGVRCGLCWDAWSAEMTKRHNNANCISIGARPVPVELALKIVQIWLDAPFDGGRHLQRINKIEPAHSAAE